MGNPHPGSNPGSRTYFGSKDLWLLSHKSFFAEAGGVLHEFYIFLMMSFSPPPCLSLPPVGSRSSSLACSSSRTFLAAAAVRRAGLVLME